VGPAEIVDDVELDITAEIEEFDWSTLIGRRKTGQKKLVSLENYFPV
jgi:hypothetical protein